MLALSIKQPWTMLLTEYDKDIENRSWRCKYRGPVLLHNSSKFDTNFQKKLDIKLWKPVSKIINNKIIGGKGNPDWKLGKIIGAGILTSIDTSVSSWWCIPDCWYWRFENIILFKKPIPCKGSLKLFKPNIHKTDFLPIDYKNYTNLSNISKKMGFERII